MRKKLLILSMCMVILLSTLSIAAVHAGIGFGFWRRWRWVQLRCEIGISLVFDPDIDDYTHWEGQIDGAIEGSFTITPLGADFSVEGIEFYWERWDIETEEGESIVLYQAGVWSFTTFKFTSGGPVMDATGAWAFLIDRVVHVRGVTSPFPTEPYGGEVTGEGIMLIPLFG